MSSNDSELGGPFHIWLQGEFLGIRTQMSELMKSVTILGIDTKDHATETSRLEVRLSKHIEEDEKVLASIQEKLADVRTAIIKKEAAWAGPKELLLFAAATVSPILAIIISVWNPFSH